MKTKSLVRRASRFTNYEAFMRKKPKILLIGDNPHDESLLMGQLIRAELDEHVGILNDGGKALAYLTDDRLDCKNLSAVFLDLSLPNAHGVKLLKVIRANESLRTLPVVIMTSSNPQKDVEQCRKLGASAFVQKPLTFSSFAKAFADTFHIRRALTRAGSLTIE